MGRVGKLHQAAARLGLPLLRHSKFKIAPSSGFLSNKSVSLYWAEL